LTAKLFTTKLLVAFQLDASFANATLDYFTKNEEHFKKSMPQWEEDFLTFEYQLKLLMKQQKEIQAGRLFKFWLFEASENPSNEIIGDISLNNIVRGAFQSCHIGYKLNAKHVGKGLMQEALQACIDYAFNELKLHRLEVNIMPSNINSIALAERLMFKKEGFSPNYLKINGKWENHIRYAMLNES